MVEEAESLLLVDPNLGDEFDTGPRPASLDQLTRINLFVGANSSGKSRMLRHLVQRKHLRIVAHSALARLRNAVNVLDSLAAHSQTLHVQLYNASAGQAALPIHFEAAQWNSASRQLLHALKTSPPAYDKVIQDLAILGFFAQAQLDNRALHHPSGLRAINLGTWFDAVILAQFQNIQGIVEPLREVSPLAIKRIYIPTLRTAHTLFANTNPVERVDGDVFAETMRHRYPDLYPSNKTPDIDVFTGIEFYDQLLRIQCSPLKQRTAKLAFERLLSRRFFDGRTVELIAQIGERTDNAFHGHINFIVDGDEHAFFNVGDGVSASALMLFAAYSADERTWLFIEEPENHLHPGFQRSLLEAFATDPTLRKRDLRIFVTTHSNHLLDVAMGLPDVSVFSFSRIDSKLQLRRVQGRDISVLDALGVRNGSVYLANCSIWVEGPSDVAYLRGILRHMMHADPKSSTPKYKEDIHYTFIEYGGSLLSNWTVDVESADGGEGALNAAAVANRIFLLADKDSGKEDKHATWQKLAEHSKGAMEYATTGGREIENEFSWTLITRIVQARLKLKEVPPELSTACPPEDYLGKHLAACFDANAALAPKVKGWVAKSGTLEKRAKRDFALLAHDILTTTSDPAEREALLGPTALALGRQSRARSIRRITTCS
jgi:hypothetical protein